MITFNAQLKLHGFSFITPGQAISPTYFFSIDCQNFNLFRPFALEEEIGLLLFPQFMKFEVSNILPPI